MPKRNDAASRKRRRAEAEARGGGQGGTAPLSKEDLAARNAAAAAEKADRPEGGGHPDPELTKPGLVEARHVSRWVRVRSRLVLRTDGKTCPILQCGSCVAESEEADTAALNHKIFAAQAGLRIKVDQERKRLGLPPKRRGPHERPDVGFAVQDRV